MIVINYDLYCGCNSTLWSDIHNSILFPLVERCGFSLTGPESIWIPQLRRCDRFQVASEEVFPSCQTKLASLQALLRWAAWTQTHQQLGTLPRNGNARKRQEDGIKMNQGKKKRELSTGWWKLKKEKGNRIPSSNCQWTRSKLNLHWRSNDFHISDFLIFGENIRRTSCEWRRPRFYIDPSLSADEEVTLRTLMPHQCAFPRGSIPSCLLDYKWAVAGFCVNLCQSLQGKAVLETGREGH